MTKHKKYKIENSDFCKLTKQELFEYIVELHEALEQPAQEPVGWMDSEGRFRLDFKTEIVRSIAAVNKEIPLYTNPAPSWQGLSDDEMYQMFNPKFPCDIDESEIIDFARAIEQALKDKNGKV